MNIWVVDNALTNDHVFVCYQTPTEEESKAGIDRKFRVIGTDVKTKFFKGETSHMDAARYAHDQYNPHI